MTAAGEKGLDLVVLTADGQTEVVLTRLLRDRRDSLRIRPIAFKTVVHPERDPQCVGAPEELLRSFTGSARHALVVFDHDGCGREDSPPEELEGEVRKKLESAGWDRNRIEAVVISPELEVWVWSDSPRVAECLNWTEGPLSLKQWLEREGFWEEGQDKPHRPKEAFEAVLRRTEATPPVRVLAKLAARVSLWRCNDRAFRRLKAILRTWFPSGEGSPSS